MIDQQFNVTIEQMDLRLLLISDTHGHLDKNIADLARQVDVVIHAGDVTEQVQPKLRTIAVAGNNDVQSLWCPQKQNYISQLPRCVTLQPQGGDIVVEHGHRFSIRQPNHHQLRNAHPDARLIVYGRTHKQVLEQDKTPWVANPGAAGLVRNHGWPKCLLLHTQGDY